MRDLSTIAKLLAEEDILVQHMNQKTACFDVKNRILSLPIWKEMSKPIQELMTIHEVGHALDTPLSLIKDSEKQNLDFSVVNVLEDVRIEKSVQKKYPGSVRIFKKGYKELIAMNFFGTNELNVDELNLIDRINLHYKHHSNVLFSDNENVWVKKANQTVTADDVITLAKELVEYIENTPESQSKLPSEDDMKGAEDTQDSTPESQDEDEKNNDSDKSEAVSKENGVQSNEDKPKEKETDGDSEEEVTAKNQSQGGKNSDKEIIITATTDTASKRIADKMLSDDTTTFSYAYTPKLILKNIIVPTKDILKGFDEHYSNQRIESGSDLYYDYTLAEFEKVKKDNKKTVSYMVKEFEMKKSADLYARSSSSKTGTLDMSKLHTYKYNDDLFAKVTTLPGATNHGLVLFLDWSGSMAKNLVGTLNQLYTIIWFCNRTKIPFEVFAFSDRGNILEKLQDRKYEEIQKFKPDDIDVEKLNLLQFFSSKLSLPDQNKMMHNLYMMAARWSHSDWDTHGYPYASPSRFSLCSTPLNSTIIAAMDIIPMFQKQSGVQKVNTIFLTDGASNSLTHKYVLKTNQDGEDFQSKQFFGNGYSYYSGANAEQTIITDPVTRNKVMSGDFKGAGRQELQTTMLLSLLKKRLPDMNVVNFFVAGGTNGRVSKSTVLDMTQDISYDTAAACEYIKKAMKTLRKDNCLIIPKGLGFDSLYLLPGLNDLDAELELEVEFGASKSQLKKAFGKMSKDKISVRPMLNNFIKMIA
tara:strand:+ start:162 stop:2423 length:2262 start_codon:yes stop_codon:yes gene_type:complete